MNVMKNLKLKKKIQWPKIDKNFLTDDIAKVIIQVNGKKRSLITTKKDLEEKDIINEINEKGLIKKYLDNEKILKTIYIKNKIINFIIN